MTASRTSNVPDSGARRSEGVLAADRLLGVTLILLQLVVLGYLSGARLFPIVMALLALWGAGTRLRLRIVSMPLNLTYSILAIGFLLHYLFAPYPLAIDSQFIRSGLAHSLARLLMSIQILQLFLHHPTGRLPVWMGPCGAVALTFATNVRTPQSMQLWLLFLIAAFVAVFALYCGRTRRLVPGVPRFNWLRANTMFTALLLILLLGGGSSWALQTHERNIEKFLADYLGESGNARRAGFNPSGRLEAVTAWRADGAEQVVLRIFADEAPGYLRGAVFDHYRGSSRETSYTPWISNAPRRPLPQISRSQSDLELRPGDLLFEVSPERRPPRRTMDIWPDDTAEAAFFIPLGIQTLATSDSNLRVNANGVVSQLDRAYAIPYMLTAGAVDDEGRDSARQTLPETRRNQLTDFDVPIDPAVRTLAADIFADCRTAAEKIAAVQRYFHENYEYQLGINIPHQMDPVTFFLTQRPGAHCEYFATGTAVLLRLARVPCRYVVGFVAAERNAVGGFWVARHKDAHAWVEAYDDASQRWVIVESTPAAGVPQAVDRNYAAQLADALRHRLSIWRMSLSEYGISALWTSLVDVILSLPGLIVLLGVLVAVLFQYVPQWSPRQGRPRVPRHLRPMHRALSQLDRQVRRRGYERAPQETLTRFASRVRRSSEGGDAWGSVAADCYDLYVDLRYQGRTGPDAIEQLRQAAAAIPAAKSTGEAG